MRVMDDDEAAELNAEPWQVALLASNPSYTFWGPREDYMWVKGDGWHSPKIFPTWADFGPWELDELNECVNFYFEITRASKQCETCGGSGYHPDAQWIAESFYDHSSPFKRQTSRERATQDLLRSFNGPGAIEPESRASFGERPPVERYGEAFRAFCEEMERHKSWHDRITQEECDALLAHHRLRDFGAEKWNPETRSYEPTGVLVTAAAVNAAQREHGAGFGRSHDAINRSILVEARCERFGVPRSCEPCHGSGAIYTTPSAHVSLILWWLHPRKGASRGIEITRIEREEIPAVRAFLLQAAARNAARFAGLAELAPPTPEERR